MSIDKPTRHNRIREALDRIYDQHPPQVREYLRRYQEDPKSRVFAPLAEAYRRLGRVDEAMGLCLEGLEHHPDFHGGRVALAKCYIDKQYFDKAKAELERVVQSVPENLLAQKLLGEVFMSLGQPHPALHCFKMAVLLSPHDVPLEEKVRTIELSLLQSTPPVQGSQTDTVALTLPIPKTGIFEPIRTPEIAPLWSIESESAGEGLTPPVQSSPVELPADWTAEVAVPSEQEPDSRSIEEILGPAEEEVYQIQSVDDLFRPESPSGEITTATLGDLYCSQGQYEKSLRIYEKLLARDPNNGELFKKIKSCQEKMGVVEKSTHRRRRQIELLQGLLERVRDVHPVG